MDRGRSKGFRPKDCQSTGHRCSMDLLHPTDSLPKGCRRTKGYRPMDCHPKGSRPMDFLPRGCHPTDFLPMDYPSPTGYQIPSDSRRRLLRVASMPANWYRSELMRSSWTFS
jgi:hypothetical protein